MTAEEVQSNLHNEFAALAHKHAHVSYAVLAVLGLLLVLGTIGGVFALKSYDKQIARAEARELQYDQDRKSWQEELKVRDAERAADALRVEQLMAGIAARQAQPLPPAVKAGLAPTATVVEAKVALESLMGDRPNFGTLSMDTTGNASLRLPQLQILVSDEVDLKRLKLDFSDSQKVVELQKGTISSLTKDLDTEKGLNTEANKVIADYKKIAKKSKWKKFFGGTKTALLMAVAAYGGHLIK